MSAATVSGSFASLLCEGQLLKQGKLFDSDMHDWQRKKALPIQLSRAPLPDLASIILGSIRVYCDRHLLKPLPSCHVVQVGNVAAHMQASESGCSSAACPKLPWAQATDISTCHNPVTQSLPPCQPPAPSAPPNFSQLQGLQQPQTSCGWSSR